MQLVFVVLSGEAWGYLGSRRFLAELDRSLILALLERVSIKDSSAANQTLTLSCQQVLACHLDDLSNVNSSTVVAAASLIARTLYILASETKDVQDSTLAAINVNVSLVEQLMDCLLDCDPCLSCELVKKYISRSSTCPNHYVGVIIDEPSSTPYPEGE